MSPLERLSRCDKLVRAGRLDEAEGALMALTKVAEVAHHAHKLLAVSRQLRRLGIIDQLEAYGPQHSSDASRPDFASEASVLISRNPDARKTVLVFTGNAQQVWISIHLLHRFLSRYDCNIVYLKDLQKRGYLLGIPELGRDYASFINSLADLMAQLGDLPLYCLGSSSGGYMALRAGIDLKATATLAFAPGTSSEGFEEHILRLGVPVPDLRDLYRSATTPPRTKLVFAVNSPRDALASRRLADLPTVSLEPVPDYDGHDVIAQTIATGSFPVLIEDFLRENGPRAWIGRRLLAWRTAIRQARPRRAPA